MANTATLDRNTMNELNMISVLGSDELEKAYKIEQSAHEFADSLPLFLSHQGDYYYNLKLEKNAQLIGFLISQVIFNEATLFNLAIDPNFQHQGFGSQLLTYWIDQMRLKKVTNFLLEVRKSNHSAIALYQKLGFKTVAIRKNYYPAHNNAQEDALIMQLLFED